MCRTLALALFAVVALCVGPATEALAQPCTIVGTAGDDTLVSGSGDDVLCGLGGNDRLHGDGGNDTLEGGGGNDLLAGGPGDDILDGGPGRDLADFTTNPVQAVTVRLDLGTATDQFGDSDDLVAVSPGESSVERAFGTPFADTLHGGAEDNVLSGGDSGDAIDGNDGDDTIRGGGGGDSMAGENGDDAVLYEGRTTPVYASADGRGNDGALGEGDYIDPAFEHIRGGEAADVLVGQTGIEKLSGKDGDDTLIARSGTDVLSGGLGNDFLRSRDGDPDRASCGAGADTLRRDSGDVRDGCETASSGFNGWLSTAAGVLGVAGNDADGQPATIGHLSSPDDVYASTTGGLYISDRGNLAVKFLTGLDRFLAASFAGGGSHGAVEVWRDTVVMISADGTTIEEYSNYGDFLSNRATGFSELSDMVMDGSTGHIIASDSVACTVSDIDLDTGTVTPIAGTGTCGFNGDGPTATTAQLNDPRGVAQYGNDILVADCDNHRVRKVTPGGAISTVAGTGTDGHTPGGPATSANIGCPRGVIDADDGGFVFTDSTNHVVRRVNSLGTISTIAGTTTAGTAGDGGPATAAQLNSPAGITRALDRGLLIADEGNHAIRFLDVNL